MKCDFCGEDLPIVGAFSSLSDTDLEAFVDKTRGAVPDGRLFVDIEEGIIEQFFCPKIFPNLDGYKHLCRRCVCKIDTYADEFTKAYQDLEKKLAQNAALNTIRKHRGGPTTPYMVIFDLDIENHPTAQVFKKTDGSYRLCNQLNDEAAGILLKHLED